MRYEIQLTKQAKRQIDNLGQKVRKRINNALRNLIDYYDGKETTKPEVKLLKGKYQGLIRLRVGDIRIIFKMMGNQFVILIIDVVSRGDAYKRK
ncbi:type II toxin-antitoxin system RelE/ParE family toxin [Bacteroidota bacterium]